MNIFNTIKKLYLNLDSTRKLLIAFGIAFSCMCIVSYTGFSTALAEAKSVDVIFENNLKPVRWINLARIDLNANRTNLYHAMVSAGQNASDVDRYLDDIPVRAARIDRNLEAVAEKIAGLNDRYLMEQLALLRDRLATYRLGRATAIDYIRNGNQRKALRAAEAQQATAFAVFQYVSNIATRIENRAKLRRERVNREAATAVSSIAALLLLTLIFSGLLISGIGIDLKTMLRSLTSRMQAVSSGDLKVADFSNFPANDIGALYLCFNSMNTMLKKLSGFIDSTTEATQDIAATAQELDRTAGASAEGAREIASRLEQLSIGAQDTVKNLTRSFQEINAVDSILQRIHEGSVSSVSITRAASERVTDGRLRVLEAIDRVRSIQGSAAHVSDAVSELMRLSNEIESIVSLIGNIADQTGLLALNASIEAARAGEHGRGFAVVASEVGKLAASSTEAAGSIGLLIEKVQGRIRDAGSAMSAGLKEVEEGVIVIEKVGEAFDDIIGSVQRTSDETTQIAGEVAKVSRSTASVVQSMETVSGIAERSAESVEGIAMVSREQHISTEEIFANAKSLTAVVEDLSAQLSGFQATGANPGNLEL